MVAPINKALLIHSVTYEEATVSEWGNSFAAPITIEHVRVEPKTSLVRNGTGTAIPSNTLLFWDSTHSTPCEWVADSKVTLNGKVLVVTSVDDFYDESKLHHKEVKLV